jgi:RNA recognition motif-containing protein
MRLFVGNIAHGLGEIELRRWFEEHGHNVESVEVIRDRLTGNSKGFGFVELESFGDVPATVRQLNGQRLAGRPLTVGPATPRGRTQEVETA